MTDSLTCTCKQGRSNQLIASLNSGNVLPRCMHCNADAVGL